MYPKTPGERVGGGVPTYDALLPCPQPGGALRHRRPADAILRSVAFVADCGAQPDYDDNQDLHTHAGVDAEVTHPSGRRAIACRGRG